MPVTQMFVNKATLEDIFLELTEDVMEVTNNALLSIKGKSVPILTPLRTAFHDTQRLLLETYASNMCSDFVLFAQLMKK